MNLGWKSAPLSFQQNVLLRELCPEGPCYVYWFALNHTVNGRAPLSELIVKAVAPLGGLPLGMELAAMNAPQREAEDIRPHTGTNTSGKLIGKTFYFL